MKIEKRSGDEERRILIGMIVDSSVLGRIGSKWKSRMFQSKWANIVAGWCLQYYRKYEEAPLSHIESLYETWVGATQDKNAVDLVGKFLTSLSEEYEELRDESNSDYIIDLAGRHFNQVQIEKLLENVQSDVDRGKVAEAHSRLSSYNQIEMGLGTGINVFQDTDAIKKAFDTKSELLIKYPGDLGKFFRNAFERGGFISFMGPEKRGKSFWLTDVAYQGVSQRRRVALFEAGDMGEDSIIRRLMVRVARHPLYPCTIDYPLSIKLNGKGKAIIEVDERPFNKGLSWGRAKRACDIFMKKRVKSKKSFFKLSSHPNSTLTIKGIISILQDWEKGEGWIPDIIIIDYADILDMDNNKLEVRDSINETWKRMRSLSQQYHCLVVTATQADSASYGKELLSMKNFSEDKRKLSHVTGMVGINSTPGEKERGLTRLNWIVLRESNINKCVHVAGCLDIANPAIRSVW